MALYPILTCLAVLQRKPCVFIISISIPLVPECVGEMTTVKDLIHRLLMFPLEKDFNVIFLQFSCFEVQYHEILQVKEAFYLQ